MSAHSYDPVSDPGLSEVYGSQTDTTSREADICAAR